MKIKKIICVLFVIISVLSSAFISFASDSTGKDFLDLADNYKSLAQFDKAITYCDKSIAIFNSIELKDLEIKNLLSKAYYLKANLLNYTLAGDEKIEFALFKAKIITPDYVAPENYTNHPTIVKLLQKTTGQYNEHINVTFDKAMNLFTEEKYCLAKEMLSPIASRYKNSELAGKILKKCKEKCLTRNTQENIKNNTEKETHTLPARTDPMKNAIGVFPVLFEGEFQDFSEKEFKEYINPEKLRSSFKKFHIRLDAPEISQDLIAQLKEQYEVDDFRQFIIQPDSDRVSIDSLLAGIGLAIKVIATQKLESKPEKKLDIHLQNKLEQIFSQIGYKYLFLIVIKKNAKVTFDNNYKQNIFFNLYRHGKYSSPLVGKEWGLTDPKQLFFILDDIAKNISEQL